MTRSWKETKRETVRQSWNFGISIVFEKKRTQLIVLNGSHIGQVLPRLYYWCHFPNFNFRRWFHTRSKTSVFLHLYNFQLLHLELRHTDLALSMLTWEWNEVWFFTSFTSVTFPITPYIPMVRLKTQKVTEQLSLNWRIKLHIDEKAFIETVMVIKDARWSSIYKNGK